MSALLRFRIGAVTAGLSFLLLGYAVAQQVQTAEETQPGRSRVGAPGQTDRPSGLQSDPSTARRGDRAYNGTAERRTANYRAANANASGANQMVDHYLATCLLGKNQAEVQLSEIAQQKSENAQVKQFAQQMIEDHKKMIEQLQPLAAMQGAAKEGASLGTRTETERRTTIESPALPGSSGAEQSIPPTGTIADAPATDTTTRAATTDRAMTGGGAIHQLGQIEKQIGDRCLQAAKEELQKKSGAEFDKCYVGMAVGAHMHALAALEVIGQQSQGQLAQVAKEAQPTVQKHCDEAKQLMKQLEGQATAAGTQAQRETKRTE